MPTSAAMLARLEALRGDFSAPAIEEKLRCLRALADRPPLRPAALKRWHSALAYARAFPERDTIAAHARDELARFHQHIGHLSATERGRLHDSGIAGTTHFCRYSFDVARWLARHAPGAAAIDWAELTEMDAFDSLMGKLVEPAEEQAFLEGGFTPRTWFDFVRGKSGGTDLDWLVREIGAAPRGREAIIDQYDAIELPVGWRLADGQWSITRNAAPVAQMAIRNSFRKPPADAPEWIARPLPGIRRLAPGAGRRVIDIAIAALAVRQREVYSMNRANPEEVWHAPLGEGVDLAVFGVLPDARPVLEGNFGYMLFANGAPIGYGGISPLFVQGNTGINIFPEYRKSEAAFLFVQTLRAFHTLFDCRHFIANPYQFGEGNSEAIGSGAFWFYYRLGFRPTDPTIRHLAEREAELLRNDRRHRTAARTLRQLAQGDLVLSLPGADSREIFSERWLTTLARGAAEKIRDRAAGHPHSASRETVIHEIARDVSRRLQFGPPPAEPAVARRAYQQLAIYVAMVAGIERWPAPSRRSLAELLRDKGAADERSYCRRLARHARFREALAAWCRAAGE